MENSILRTYKFYNHQGKRLSIFGRVTGLGKKMEMFILTCSKKDAFSKKFARKVYENYINVEPGDVIHPMIILIPIVDDDPAKTFFTFCEETYYKMIPVHKTEYVLGISKNQK